MQTATELIASSRPVSERVRTYQTDALSELLREGQTLRDGGQASTSSPSLSSGSSSRVGSARKAETRDPTIAERAAAQLMEKEKIRLEKIEAHRKRVERKRLEETERKELEFQSMYQDVLDGLSNSQGIMGETRAALEHSARTKDRKKEQLHDEWEREVFDKIQARLQSSVDSLDQHTLESRLRSQMGEYLHATNTKLGVFRDVIIEKDYNPLASQQATIRIPTGDIRDPVKRDVLKPMYEAQLMGRSAPSTPLGKTTLETTAWGALQITASPYGHCVDKEGNYVVRPSSARAQALRESHIPLDHYTFPRDNESAQQEMGRIGKNMPPGPEMRRGRNGLFDVMQQTVGQRPGYTGGDIWLEAKGKGSAVKPEERRGRGGLAEVIQQSSNPYVDGRVAGDQWMEAKGKAHPPGPEQRRGRQGLSEIIQQSSNYYKDGRTLDDAFLEQKGKAMGGGPAPTIGPVIASYQNPPDPQPTNKMGAKRAESHLVNERTLTVREGAGKV